MNLSFRDSLSYEECHKSKTNQDNLDGDKIPSKEMKTPDLANVNLFTDVSRIS